MSVVSTRASARRQVLPSVLAANVSVRRHPRETSGHGSIVLIGKTTRSHRVVGGSTPPGSTGRSTNRVNNQTNNPAQHLSADIGLVAQLGERLHGMQEVVGSIPTRSTGESNAEG